MIGGPPFPVRPSELTTDVLEAALGLPVAGFSARVVGADRGMLGDLLAITPVYRGASGPAVVIAKFAADREGSLGSARRGGTHLRELRFYDELAPVTPARVPLSYASWYDPESARFLLIQEYIDADLSVDQIVGLDVRRAAQVLTEVAGLHGRWWQAPQLGDIDWIAPLDSAARRHNLGTITSQGWGLLCDLIGDELSAEERCIGRNLAERLDNLLVEMAKLPSTLIHSDLRADNLLFPKSREAAVIVDWQGVGIGPPGWDLAYFMSQSLSVEVRRRHEDQLIDHYLSTLAEHGAHVPREIVMAGYGESMLFGLIVACSLPLAANVDDPRVAALARTMTRRSIEALRDHGHL